MVMEKSSSKIKFYSKNTMIKESPPSKVNKFHSPFILTNFVIVVRDDKVSVWEESLIHFILPSIVIPLLFEQRDITFTD